MEKGNRSLKSEDRVQGQMKEDRKLVNRSPEKEIWEPCFDVFSEKLDTGSSPV